ncbi:MAG: hypothetical protein U0271_39480 [Polyangiaceae bacterium]
MSLLPCIPTSVGSVDLRRVLAEPELRASLTAMVSRRVPNSEVDDVVQSALCAALAAERRPSALDEVPRWVMGIALHKVADTHRKVRRERATEPAQLASASLFDPIEERLTLARILDEGPRDRSHRDALEWALREGCGERLNDIAAEVALPHDVVRKRVSRLRARMRARWLGAAVFLALLVGRQLHEHALTERRALVAATSPTPTAFSNAPLSNAMVQASGATPMVQTLRVTQLEIDPAIQPTVAALVRTEARSARVSLSRGHFRFDGLTRTYEGSLRVDDTGRGTLELDDGRKLPVHLSGREGDRWEVEIGVADLAVGVRLVLEPERAP